MGSPCELQLTDATGAADASAAIAAVVADVERLEARYSRYRDTSFLAAINRVAAAGGSIEVDPETASLLNYASTCYLESDGMFDVTSGLLRRAWNFAAGVLPDPERVEALLARIGWDKVRWEPPVLTFPVAGMELDLGGVVKEYAADRAAALCRAQGVRGGFVNLGGDLAIIGPRADGGPWTIGLRHPRVHERSLQSVHLRAGGLATSGDYERCMVVDGIRYGHLLNPRTGWPVRHLAAVTVAADLCVVAGSASTIAMLKEEDGPAWLARMGLPHLWVSVTGDIGGPLAR